MLHKYVKVVVTANDGNGSSNQTSQSTYTAITNTAPANDFVPVIMTTGAVGYPLLAFNGIWSDADTDTLTYTYQWYRATDAAGTGAAAISGATSASYTLTTSDAHKFIKVMVTANDGNGSSTVTAESAYTMVYNLGPTYSVAPLVTGTTTVGGTLSSGTGTWADTDGDTLTYTYQWYRATDAAGTGATAISGATLASYTLTTADAHRFLKVVVTANDANGSSTQTAESTYTAIANTAPANSAVPTVSGTATVGNALTTTNGTWSDTDGDTVSYSYQWYRATDGSGTGATAISGATLSSYTLTTTDAHKYVKVVVTANDGNGSSTQTSGSAYTAITNTAPVNTVVPAISGTATVGNALSTSNGTWSDTDGDTVSYSYQWYRATDSAGNGATAISGATLASYTLTTADAHRFLKVVVTANDANGSSTQTAESTYTAITNTAPTSSAVPTVSGTATVGNALTTTNGTWSDTDGDTTTYTYQWYRATDSSGTGATAISGATLASYTLTTADAHRFLKVVVTANDGNGSSTRTAESVYTAITNTAPVNTVIPAITGTASVGYTLSTSTGTWTDTDSDSLTYSYQWYRADNAGGTNLTAISGATLATYTVTTSEAYKYVSVVVTANDANGSATQTATSNRTAITNTAPVLTTPTAISLTDTAAADTFANQTGTLAATDADADTLTYGISGGTTGGSTTIGSVTYDVSKTGTYGTLYVKGTTGAYVFVPSDTAINALSAAASETFSVTASDPLASIDTRTLTINISAVNDNPILSTPTTGVTYTEQATALAIGASITVADADTGATAQSATVTLASPVSGDVLAVTTPGPYTASYNSVTGVLTLTGGGTLAQMQTALRSLTFSSASDDPTLEGTRTGRTVSIQIDDGKGSNNLSNTITSSFTVAAVNDSPVVTAGTGATPTHAPGLGAVVVDSGLTLADVDNANLTGATVTLTNRPNGTAEALALTGAARTAAEAAGITVGAYDTATGALSLSGTATKAAYQAALRAVTYDNSLAIPNNTARSITFTVRDPSGDTATRDATSVSRSVVFNTTPSMSANTGMTVAEGASAQTITSAMLAATDAEQTPSGLIYTVTALTANGTLRLNGNALALNSTFTQGDVDAGRVTYSHDGSETLSDSFGFSVADGTTTLTGRSFAITVTPVNDLPVISGVSATAIDITDKRTAKPFTDASLSDSDLPAQSITVQVSIAVGRGSLAGNGSHAGTFNAATGVWSFTGTTAEATKALQQLVFTPTENRVPPGTVDTVALTLSVSDGTGTVTNSNAVVNVLSVNDAPYANRTVSRATATQGAAFSLTVPTSAFADDDAGDPLTITASLPNGDSLPSWLTFNSATGTFTGTPANADVGTLTVRLTATDKAGKSASDIFILTVENVNDAPIAVNDRVSTDENTAFSLSASQGVLSNDTDPDTGDTRVVSEVNGAASSVGKAITLSGGGQLTIRQNGTVVFDPNGAYTALNAGQSVVEQVRYTIVDAKGATSTATLFITVEGRNNGPVLQPDKTVTVDQDSGAVGLSITKPVDAEGDPLTIRISALPGIGTVATAEGVKVSVGTLLTATQLANLTYTPPAGFSGDAGTLIYSVSDGSGIPAEQAVKVSVTSVQRFDVAAKDAVKSEGNSGSTLLTFRITRTGDTSAETVIDWQVNEPTKSGQANRDDFVGGLPFGKVTMAAGASYVDVSIAVAGDTDVESDETFTFAVTGTATSVANGKVVWQRDTAQGAILDDDRDVTPPTIVSVTTPAAGNYVDGDKLTFTVKFSEAIDRTALGTPRLALTIGKTVRYAELVTVPGQSADSLTFSYTVTPDDADNDGISVGQKIDLTSGKIQDAAGNSAATNLRALKTGDVIVNTFKGVVVDGYITGGTVFADANRNSVLDAGESSSITDSSGNFEILGGSGPYILIGGTDISTGLAFKGIFEAPPRAKVINPLTTLLSGVAGLSATDAQIADAQTVVKAALGLDSGIDLLTYDPIVAATTSGRSAAEIAIAVSAQGEAAKIANLMIQGTSVLAGAATSAIDTGDAGRAILAALADTVKALPAGTKVDLASPTTIEAVLRNAAGRLSGIDASRVAAVAADAARVIGAGNGAVDTASSDTSGSAVDNLTRMAQAQVVAQGTAATALKEGTAGNGLTDAVSNFTGTNLSTQVDQAVAGIVVPSRLEIVATDAAKPEGDSGFTAYTFTVTRSGSLSGALTVDWQVSGSDTLDGADFGGTLPSGKVTFADGETTKTIAVSIAGDQTIEADETFSVQLSNPTVAAALVTDTAFGVILNDDPAAPQITLPATATALVGEATAISGLSVADGNSATVTVSLTPVNGLVALTGPATISASGSVLSVTGSVANVNATLATLRFTGTAGNATGAIDVAVSDGDPTTTDAAGRLTISILSPPENTLPARPTVVAGVSSEIFGISVADTDSGTLTVTLTPTKGTVSVTQFGTATVTGLSGDRVQVSGTTADVNKVLASLEFTAVKNTLGASLLIATGDGDDRTADDSDLLSIDVVSSPESATVTAQTVVAGTPQTVSGITVGDFDTAELQVTLIPTNGQIGVEAVGSAVLTHPNATTLRLTGTIADINASLAGLTFTGTIGSTSGSVQVITTDLDARTPDPTITVDFTILNAPTLDLPRQPSVVAGTTVSLKGITVADADPGAITVTLTPTGGTLAAQAAAGATVATGSDGTLTITGAVANVNATLGNLTFTAGKTASTATIVLHANDGDSRTTDAQATLSISISASVDLELPKTQVVLAAGTAAPLTGISLSEAGSDLITVRLTATNGLPVLTAQGGAAVADLGGGVYTLIGNSSDINSTLATMTFNGTQGATSASLRVQVDFTDKALPAIDKTLSIGLVNAPIFTVPDTTKVVTAGQSGVISGISVTDFDDANLTVTVAPSGGTVTMAAVGSATVTTGTDGRLIVSGTKADINATLAGLNFTAATGVKAGSVTLTASDSDPLSPDVTATLPITIVSPSVVTLPTTGTAIAGVPTELHGFSVTDTDSASVTATLVPTGGTVAATASGSATVVVGTDGTLTVTGSPADVTATLESIKFTMIAGATAPSLAVTVSDGDSRTADPSTVINLTVSTVKAPLAGGDITATATDNTTLYLPEDSSAPTGANIRLSPSILPNADGYSPNAIRILSFSGGTLTMADGTAIHLGASGSVLMLSGGGLDLRFTPDANRDTAATLRYVMVDTVHGTPNSAASTATIAITPVNDTPISGADTGTVGVSGTLSVAASSGLLANDRDVDTGDSLTVSAVNDTAVVGQAIILPSGARVTVNADGSYSYDANGAFASLAAGAKGTDSFTYTVRDRSGTTSTATVTLTITGVNDAPVANADALNVAANAKLTGDVAGVLANDSDIDTGDTLRVSAINGAADAVGRQITLPSGALLKLNADGSYSYDPNGRYDKLAAGVTATDSFSYTIRDGGLTSTATVTLTIRGVNDAPVAVNDTATLTENSIFSAAGIGVLVNDTDIDTGDTLTVSAVNDQTASVGQTITLASGAKLLLNAEGSYRYDTNGAFRDLAQGQSRTDSFTYTVKDRAGATSTATVTLTITGVNNAPVAVADSGATTATQAITATGAAGLLTNDTDIDSGDRAQRVTAVNGTAASVGSAITLASGAKLTVAVDGSYIYDPNGAFKTLGAGQTTTDSFTYTVADGFGGTAVGTATITITGVNDKPTAVNDSATVTEKGVLTVPKLGVLANDTDINQGDRLTVTAVEGAPASVGKTITLNSGALLTLNADGSYVYDPNGRFNALNQGQSATDSFTYTASDISGESSTATVVITITGLGDGPVPKPAPGTAFEDSVATISAKDGVLSNLTDPDLDDTATVSAVEGVEAAVGRRITLTSGALLRVNADGSYSYSPNGKFEALAAGQTTTDSFTVTVRDSTGNTATATVTLTVIGANDAPVAKADTVVLGQNDKTTVPASAGVLANDTDVDTGAVLTVTAVNGQSSSVGQAITLASGAKLTLNADGGYAYDTNGAFSSLAAGQTTTDSFSYTVGDGIGGTSTATLTLTITGTNDAPVATADTGTVAENGTLVVKAADGLLKNDTDGDQGTTLTVSAVNGSSAAVGSTITLTSGAKLTVKADGSYAYDPNGKFDSLAVGQTTSDSFSYTVSDGAGGTATAKAIITIAGANNAPVAVADAVTVAEDAVLAVPAKGVLANDTDADSGTTLSVTAVNGDAASVGSAITLASGAKVTMKADGSYTVDTNGKYNSLAAGETVTESFSYTVSDGSGGSATGKATVTITGTNDAPTAQGTIAAETAREGVAFSRAVPASLFADADTSDKLTLSADLTSGAALPGWLKFDAATGTFSGTPTGSDTGTITVRVTATDPSGAAASVSFVLKIEEAPKAVTQGEVAPVTTTTVTSTPMVVTAAPSLVILPLFQSSPSSTDKADTTSSSTTTTVTSSTTPTVTSDVSPPNTVTIAASQSWMVSIGDSGAPDGGGLRVLNPVPDQRLGTDAASSFRLPAGVFAHSDKNAVITIKATLADGSPLPKWLKFDASSGTFSGSPPAGEKGKLDIKITARDKSGTEAVVKFKLSTAAKSGNVAAADQVETPADGQMKADAAGPRDHQTAHAPLPGRPSLTAQVKAAGRDGFMAEGLALLESLLKAAGGDIDKAA